MGSPLGYPGCVPSILPRFDFRVSHAVAKDVGKRRQSYEDVALVAPELAVFAVADGMGGHRAGEVAARIAIEELKQGLSGRAAQHAVETYLTRADLESRRNVFACLRQAVEHANQRVREAASESEERAGMGATLDVVWLARDHAFVVHAGDGRVYLARSRAVLQVTQDHTPSEGLRQSQGPARSESVHRSGITNALGLGDSIRIDAAFVDLSKGDRILLCSDGVHTALEGEAELSQLLRSGDAQQAADALVARAAEQGRDNATAVVVEIEERFVRRVEHDRGLEASDLDHARQSPLLVDLPESVALSALSAAVEIELGAEETIPRVVASDLVAYIVLEGVVSYRESERRVGAGALIYAESLVGVVGQGEEPTAEQTTRVLRVRADDFQEVCLDPRLGVELYRRVAQHLARSGTRAS